MAAYQFVSAACVCVSSEVISTETQRPKSAPIYSPPSLKGGESNSLSVCAPSVFQTRSWPQTPQQSRERESERERERERESERERAREREKEREREREREMWARTRETALSLEDGLEVRCPRSSSQTQMNKHTQVLLERKGGKKALCCTEVRMSGAQTTGGWTWIGRRRTVSAQSHQKVGQQNSFGHDTLKNT